MGTGGTSTIEQTMASTSTPIRREAITTWAVEVMNLGLGEEQIILNKIRGGWFILVSDHLLNGQYPRYPVGLG